jgi:hypothetical protein
VVHYYVISEDNFSQLSDFTLEDFTSSIGTAAAASHPRTTHILTLSAFWGVDLSLACPTCEVVPATVCLCRRLRGRELHGCG